MRLWAMGCTIGAVAVAVAAAGQSRGEIVPDKILVELHAGRGARRAAADAEGAAKQLGARQVDRMFGRNRYAVISLNPGDNPHEAAARAARMPEIAAAAPVGIRRLVATPNDPLFSPNQWALNNSGQTVVFPDPSDPSVNITLTGVADADIDAPEAWNIQTGSSSVVVAVIDSGFPLANADLNPNLWVNTDEVAGDGIDNDGNGYVDDRNGYNFYSKNGNIDDDHGHGSFCSGIIGARGNNGSGIAGINWNVSIMGLKPFSSTGSANDADLVEAIDYAAANGARIINASWGDWLYSPVVENAVRSAGTEGVLFVAAAGNDGMNLKQQPFYPACLSLPNLINVGATDIKDKWAGFSNYDDTMVDCHAPGYWVYSSRQSSYEYASGTSFATPQVVGVAALLLAQSPSLSVGQLRARVISALDRRTALEGRGSTAGRVSAQKALSNALSDSTPPATIGDLAVAETASNGFRLTFSAPGDDGATGTPVLYEGRVSTSPISESSFFDDARIFHMPHPSGGGSNEWFYAAELLPSTTYYIRVRATDDAGNVSALSNQVVATTAGRTVYFTDDMESGAGKWNADAPFALTTEFANSGTTSWTDSPGGNYAASQILYLTTKDPIDLSTATDPWLSFFHRYMFDASYTTAGDNGEVRISTDGVNYTSLAQFVNYNTPFHLARVNLKAFAGQPTVYVRFRFRSDFSSKVNDGWYIDDVEVYQPESLVPEPADFAVESCTRFTTVATAPTYVETSGGGSWFTSVSKAALSQLRTARSRYNVTTTLGSTARFTPQLAVDGSYEVFVAWGSNANANNVRHRVYHADGSTDVYLNQDSRVKADTWHSLGTYRFVRGQSAELGSVMVDDSTVTGIPDSGAEGRVYADSVRFLYRPAGVAVPTLTPTPSPTATASPSPTASATASLTSTPSPSASVTPTETATPSPTSSATPSPSESPTSSPSASVTASPTSSPTASPTVSPTVSSTATATASPSPTAVPDVLSVLLGLRVGGPEDDRNGDGVVDAGDLAIP